MLSHPHDANLVTNWMLFSDEAGSSQQHLLQEQQQVPQYVKLFPQATFERLTSASRQTLSPADLAFQETIIQERETEIREIETGIHELNEIFRDLGTLVIEQGGMLGEWAIDQRR